MEDFKVMSLKNSGDGHANADFQTQFANIFDCANVNGLEASIIGFLTTKNISHIKGVSTIRLCSIFFHRLPKNTPVFIRTR